MDYCKNGGIKAQYDFSHLDRYTHAHYFIGWRIVDERVIQLNCNTIKKGKSFYSFKAWLTIVNSSI